MTHTIPQTPPWVAVGAGLDGTLVLEHTQVRIPDGGHVLITGPTGSGKTHLAHLLADAYHQHGIPVVAASPCTEFPQWVTPGALRRCELRAGLLALALRTQHRAFETAYAGEGAPPVERLAVLDGLDFDDEGIAAAVRHIAMFARAAGLRLIVTAPGKIQGRIGWLGRECAVEVTMDPGPSRMRGAFKLVAPDTGVTYGRTFHPAA